MQRHLRIDLGAAAAERTVVHQRADDLLRADAPQVVVDDACRRRKRVALRGDPDADRRAFDQARGQGAEPVEIQTFDPHVAGFDRREIAHVFFVVDADALVADAAAEGVFRAGGDVLLRALCERGSRNQQTESQRAAGRDYCRERSSAWREILRQNASAEIDQS